MNEALIAAAAKVPPAHIPHAIALLSEIGNAAAQVAQLSPREQDVLRLLARGMVNKTVAWHLGVSPRTVEIHRASLYARLGVGSIAALARYAFLVDVGTIPPAPRRDPKRLHWTAEKDASLVEMRAARTRWRDVGAVLGVSPAAAMRRLAELKAAAS